MASKKITAMPNLAGAQVPTDLTTLVDLSVAPAVQNVKSTLNDLFAYLTKNITDKAVRFQGAAAPAVSGANEGSIYYDLADNQFKVSQNGGAYANLISGTGVASQVSYWSSAGVLASAAGFVYQAAASPNVTITAQNNAYVSLRVQPAGNSYTVVPFEIAGNSNGATLLFDPIAFNDSRSFANLTVLGSASEPFPGIAVATPLSGSSGTDGAYIAAIVNSSAGIYLEARGPGYSNSNFFTLSASGKVYTDANASAGLVLLTSHASAPIRFATGGSAFTNERLRILESGQIQLYPIGTSAGNTNELRFLELVANGANYVGFKSPDSIAANKIWTLPNADGTSGQALTTNGSATLSWSTLLSVAGVTGSVQINNGGGLLDGDGQFVYDPLTATVTIGSSALTGKLRLQAVTSGNGITIQTDAPAGNHTYVWPNALPTTTGQALTATGISGSTITLGWQAAGGTTINSTDEFLPYRLNSTTFADSPIRRTGTQTVFITDGVTNFVSLGTGGVQTYQDGSSTFPIINLNSAGGLYVTSTHPAIARAGSAHTVFTAGQTLSVQDGTVSAPSWSFNADANTGIYRSAADTLNIAVGGVNPLEVGTVYVSLISGATATELRLYEPSGSGTNYTAFKAQAQAASLTFTLPAADGSSGQALTTNGSGTLSWAAPTPGTFGDGSAAAPSITFTADTNTGFYRPIAENISATTAGVGIASFTVDGMTVGFVDQFSFATLYVSGKNSSYPAAIIRSVDSPTQNILEVTRKVGVNDYDVLTVRPFGDLFLTSRPRTGTATPFLQVITPEDAALTASTQSIGLQFGGNTSQATVTRQWATGALALQQEIVVVAPTYAFVGASTLTLAATFSITGAPKAGTNATLTKTVAAYFGSGAAAAVALLVEGSGTPSANIFEARLTSGASVFLAATQRETLYLAPIATVSSPTNGDVWSDSSRNTLASRIAGQNLFFSSCIFRAIDDKLVDNTTTETTLLAASVVGTATIAANHFQPGKVVKLRARGYWNTDAGNSSFNIRFKIGGVTIATGAINATASMTTLPWDVEIEATCRTTGVTGTIMIAGSFNNIQDGTTRAAYKWDMNAGAAGTIDTTGALTVDLTAQMGTATADNYIVCTSLVIELVG